MMGEIFALRRLRWKLTLSYTLVAAVTLLALELILAGALVAFLNSPLLPRLVVQNFRDEVAPRLERPLNQNPPDTEAIRERLGGFADNSGVRGADRPPPPVSPSNYAADQGALLVVDDRRRLLVSVPEMRGFPEGRRFDAGSISGLKPLVNAAFDGEENSGQLSSNVEGQVVTVTPIEGWGSRRHTAPAESHGAAPHHGGDRRDLPGGSGRFSGCALRLLYRLEPDPSHWATRPRVPVVEQGRFLRNDEGPLEG
jgi:hypothetical protein